MLKNLNTGMIGVNASLAQSIDLARRHGFRSVDFSITEAVALADEIGIDGVRSLFEDADIFPGSWGFPINFRQDETTWRDGLMANTRRPHDTSLIGTRCCRATWISSITGSAQRS